MNFKRFNGSTWDAIHHKTYDTMTESLTSFPAVIQASGEALTDYTISGKTVQDGTPTPEAPVDVVGCGERTKNLYDKSVYTPINGYSDNSGKWTTPSSSYRSVIMPCEPNTSYVISKMITNRQRISTYPTYPANGDIALQVEKDGDYDAWSDIVTDANAHYMAILLLFDNGTTGWIDKLQEIVDSLQVEIGTQPTSYEPYGYKLPLTVNGTEHPIYLGRVPTTRRIRKYEFTGNEDLYKNSSQSTNYLYYAERMVILTGSVSKTPLFCNELPVKTEPPISVTGINTKNDFRAVYLNFGADVMNAQPSGNTVSGLKEYLAAQYAAGTPVTIWYVLAAPGTGIVNEPIHKIGDYADTISFAQAGATIQTSDGDNLISFGTTVKPSAMSATFKGWHPVQGAKVYDGNDWG